MIDNYLIYKLLNLNGFGYVRVNKVLKELSKLSSFDTVAFESILNAQNKLSEWKAMDELQYKNSFQDISNNNIFLTSILSKEYPQKLKNRLNLNSPPLLYFKGNPMLFNSKNIAIIGSRKASTIAISSTEKICMSLAREGFNIVSGYAKGVDMSAHLSAIHNEGTTSIVIPTGLKEFKLKSDFNTKLNESDFLVVSEFPIHSKWSAPNAMIRNKTIIGLSDAVIVIQSGKEKDEHSRMSGTFNSANTAIKYKIPVLVVSPSIVKSDGNKDLINKGALAIDPQNVIDQLISLLESSKDTQTNLF